MSFICTWICVVSFTFLCLVTILVVPFCIYITHTLYNIRRHQALVRRYPSILMLSSILSILYIFIIIQYMVIDSGILHEIEFSVLSFISRPFLILIVLIRFLRIWLINYDINQNVIQSRHEWQSLLRIAVKGDDWYSQNRHKWGNFNYLLKICVFLWIFLCILCITPLLIDNKSSHIAYVATIMLLLLCIGAISYKAPHFKDTFSIMKEIKILTISAMIYCTVWLSLMYWVKHGNVFDLLQILMVFLFVLSPILISECMVIYMVYSINPKCVGPNKSAMRIVNKNLFSVLIASDIGIEEYLKHLQHECCTENFLFFVETMQWLYATTDQEWSQHDIAPFKPENLHFNFSEMIPMSSINGEEDTDWFCKIQKIYTKYVHSSAEYEVNLPYNIRNEFAQLLRLYKMKIDILSGEYVAKCIKKPRGSNATRPRKGSFSSNLSTKLAIDSLKKTRSMEHTQGDQIGKIPTTIEEENEIDATPETQQSQITMRSTMSTRSTMRSDTKKVTFAEILNFSSVERDVYTVVNNLSLEQDGKVSHDTPKTPDIITITPEIIHNKPNMCHQDTAELESICEEVLQIPSDIRGECSSELREIFEETMKQLEQNHKEFTKDENENKYITRLKPPKCIQHKETEVDVDVDTETDDDNDDEDTPDLINKVSPSMHSFLDSVLPYVAIQIPPRKETETENALNIDTIMVNHSESRRTTPLGSVGRKNTLETPVPHLSHLYASSTSGRRSPFSVMSPMSPFVLERDYSVARNLSMKSRSKITLVNTALRSLHRLTQPSITKQISEFVDDEDVQNQYDIDPEELKQMEMAQRINVSHFVSICCFALHEVLLLNYQSISRFKRSSYFHTFYDNVNLEQLLDSASPTCSKKDINHTK